MKASRTSARLILAATLLAAGHTVQATEPAQVSDGMLTGSNGMTLYTFDRDA